MAGEMLIEKNRLQDVLDANREVLAAAGKLIEISRADPGLKSKLVPVITQLLNSGTRVNTAIASVEGLTTNPR